MAPRVRVEDRETVISSLEALVKQIPKDKRDNRDYHECERSYSYPEIIAEVRQRTPMGKSFVKLMVDQAAQYDNVSVAEYMNSGVKPSQ